MTDRSTYFLAALLATQLLLPACSGDEEPEQTPPCAADSECADNEICDEDAVCVVEQGLCSSSAECEDGRFCVPRDDSGGKEICDRVVRCDEVDPSDVNALCRQNNSLMGDEKFRCDVSIPDAPTCIREDRPAMDMGSDMPEDMPGDMADSMDMDDMMPNQGCQSSDECFGFGEYCLSGPVNTCGTPTTCDEVIARDRVPFCTRDSGFTLRACNPTSTTQDRCETIDEPLIIKIQDVSSGDASCDSTDPGSDIMGVRLRNLGTNRIITWGTAANERLGSAGPRGNKYDTTVRLDGFDYGLSDTMMCPAGGVGLSQLDPPAFSMGCGGWMMIYFFDEQISSGVELEPGMSIEVLEYGSTCGGSSSDRYQVKLCSDPRRALEGFDESCTYDLGALSEGFGEFSLGDYPTPQQ